MKNLILSIRYKQDFLKWLVLCCLFFSTNYSVSAQNAIEQSLKNQFGIKAGWTNSLIADRHSSPLLYEANAANFGVIYQNQASFLLEVSLSISIGTNQSKSFGKRSGTVVEPTDIFGHSQSYEVEINPFLSMLNGNLQVKALWSLDSRHQIGATLQARHFMAGLGVDTWHFSQLSLAPTYTYERNLGKADLRFGFSLPIIAAVVRPNFSKDAALPDVLGYWQGYLKTNTKVSFLDRFFNPSSQLGIFWKRPNGSDVGVNYSAQWLSYPLPRPLKMFEQSLDLLYFF